MWAGFAPFLPATRLKSQRLDAAEEPETLEVLRVQMSESARAALESAGVRFGVNVLLSRPNGPALRA